MKFRLVEISILLTTLAIGVNTSDEQELWCYHCNADLTEGRKAECNDPYTPETTGLIKCPQNETQLCLKSLIFYKNVHVTVRGCVPAKEKSSYCSFQEAYPDASLECLFCNDYGCNASPPAAPSSTNRFLLGSLIAVVFAVSANR